MAKRGHIFTVGQNKGGAGKTTYAMSLAIALAGAGKPVLAIDSDFTNTHLTKFLRKRNEFIRKNPDCGLPLIKIATELNYKKLSHHAGREKDAGGYVVIDVSAAHNELFLAAMGLGDTILLPTRQGYFDLDSAERLAPYLTMIGDARKARGLEKAKIYSLLTDYRSSGLGRRLQEILESELGSRFLGVVPHSDRLGRCLFEGKAIWEMFSGSARAIAIHEMMDRCISGK